MRHAVFSGRPSLAAWCVIVCAIARPCHGQSPPIPSNLSAADWRADLQFLSAQLTRRAGDAFEVMSLRAFRDSVASLDRRIPSLNVDQIVVGLATIVAAVGDPRTQLQLPRDWPRLGLAMRWFGCNP